MAFAFSMELDYTLQPPWGASSAGGCLFFSPEPPTEKFRIKNLQACFSTSTPVQPEYPVGLEMDQ